MIGELINKFDNSDGTIKAFNEIFSTTNLEGSGDVEILGIVGVGKLYTRHIEVNGKRTEYNFDPLSHPTIYRGFEDKVKKKRGVKKGNRKGISKYVYFATKDGTTLEFSTGVILAEFLGVHSSTLTTKFTRAYTGRDFKGYKLTRKAKV